VIKKFKLEGDLNLQQLDKNAAEKRARIEAEIAAERKLIEESNERKLIEAENAAKNARELAKERKLRISAEEEEERKNNE
jgi:hypothetical protein